MTEKTLIEKLTNVVVEGDLSSAEAVAREAIKAELDPLMAIEEGLVPGISRVGKEFDRGDLYLTDLMLSAEAMKICMEVLLPEVARRGRKVKFRGRVILGTVAGDIHSIGKEIVGTMLMVHGFEVTDLGVDVPDETFINKVKELKPNILGLSALMTSTMNKQLDVIKALKKAGLRDRVKVMVGGAAVTEDWAREIGADAYGVDAVDAIKKAEEFV